MSIYNKLYRYQQNIIDTYKHNKSNALFMGMGTGKTLTSLGFYEQSGCKKLLVICLCSKLHDWQKDLKQELNIDAVVLDKGTTKNNALVQENNDCYVVNFESAWRCTELLSWVDNNTMVLIDEAHKCKTHNSKIGKFCDKLRKKTKHKLILTGTPQSKGYIDYYAQLKFVDLIDTTYTKFCDEYCVYEKVNFTGYPFKQLVGYKNTDKLDKIIKENCIFYERKVDDDMLPSDVNVSLDTPSNYKKYKRERVYKDIASDSSGRLFADLRTFCSGHLQIYKVNDIKIKWLKDFIEDLNDRVVIFYNFNCERDDIIELLEKLGIPYSEYSGRIKDLTNFKEHKNGVAICQYLSASTGLNDLIHAYICVMYSPTTNYTDYAQSRKRIDRIGQTKKPLYYNLYCRDTVEEKILSSLKDGKDFDEKMFNTYLKEK